MQDTIVNLANLPVKQAVLLRIHNVGLLPRGGYSKTGAEQESKPLLLSVWNFGIMDRTGEDVEDLPDFNFDEISAGRG